MQRNILRLARLAQSSELLKASCGSPLASLKDLPSLITDHYSTPYTPLLTQQTFYFSHSQLRSYAGGSSKPSGVPAGAYQPPAGAARPSNIRVTLVSSNLLAEPYKGEPPSLPVSTWVKISGWKERWRRWMGGVKSIYTIAKIRKNVDKWSLPAFKEEALKTYQEACEALAAGDKTALRQLVTPTVFTDMKRQIKAREDGGWKRVDWQMVTTPTLKEIEVVQGRLIAIDPKNDNTGFAQLTVRFKSRQKFAAYDGKGKLKAGSEDGEIGVDDFWVFERPLKSQAVNRWKVAARLVVPQEGYLLRE